MSDVNLERENYSGTWNGRDIRFNRVFRKQYRFTDEECEQLLAGGKVVVKGLVSRGNGSTYDAEVAIVEKTISRDDGTSYQYTGPDMVGFPKTIPHSLLGHTFTEDEYAMLEAGNVLQVDDLVSRSGVKFAKTIKYNTETGRFDFLNK